jgi:hypothetical protein
MGQRLNIEIKNNEKFLANCYYHWSGYTTSSLELTKEIINCVENNNVKPDVNGAIKVLRETGATFSKPAWDKAKEENIVSGDYLEYCDRDNGIIAVTDLEMKETRAWEEGRITINIENKTFDFKCATEKDLIEDEEMWKRVRDLFYEIKGLESSYKIPFSSILNLLEGVETAIKSYQGRFYFKHYAFQSIY